MNISKLIYLIRTHFYIFVSLLSAFFLLDCASVPRFTSSRGFEPPIDSHNNNPAPANAKKVTEGIASYYGLDFNGKKAANGEIFDMHQMTAAHRSYPFGTKVRVTNLENGKSVVVRVNDRGPFKLDRIMDVSYGAAEALDMIKSGIAKVKLEVLEWGPSNNN